MPLLDTGLSWLKQIPLTATVAAAAAAALSIYLQDERDHSSSQQNSVFGETFADADGNSSANNGKNDDGCARGISWSDEHGQELVQMIEPLSYQRSMSGLSEDSQSSTGSGERRGNDDGDGPGIRRRLSDDDAGALLARGSAMTAATGAAGSWDGGAGSEGEGKDSGGEGVGENDNETLDEVGGFASASAAAAAASDSKSPVSPQWGWYVSITPPQSNMYQQSRANTPPPSLVSH